MNKCPYCDYPLHWQSDFNLDEVYPELEEYEGAVSIWSCNRCDIMFDLIYAGDGLALVIPIKYEYLDDEE